jgi:hypothetical protein
MSSLERVAKLMNWIFIKNTVSIALKIWKYVINQC